MKKVKTKAHTEWKILHKGDRIPGLKSSHGVEQKLIIDMQIIHLNGFLNKYFLQLSAVRINSSAKHFFLFKPPRTKCNVCVVCYIVGGMCVEWRGRVGR